jgi:hypothetical protein
VFGEFVIQFDIRSFDIFTYINWTISSAWPFSIFMNVLC